MVACQRKVLTLEMHTENLYSVLDLLSNKPILEGRLVNWLEVQKQSNRYMGFIIQFYLLLYIFKFFHNKR